MDMKATPYVVMSVRDLKTDLILKTPLAQAYQPIDNLYSRLLYCVSTHAKPRTIDTCRRTSQLFMSSHIASKTLEDIDSDTYLGRSGELDGLTLYLETLYLAQIW